MELHKEAARMKRKFLNIRAVLFARHGRSLTGESPECA